VLVARDLLRLHVGPVQLHAEAGTCVSVEGRSGSGKSVLLRMLADLDPHAGDCELDGQRCSAIPAPAWRRLVTYVAAEAGWWSDDVAAHFPHAETIAPLLPRVGIAADALTWPVSRLSTGERQRLALLRAFTPANRVLLLDEPTSGLDDESRDLVGQVLRERLAQGTTIVLVTHDPEFARRLATASYEMRDGRLAAKAA
jgi:ABC-type multidrug transport system ATPase subunit